MSKSQKSIKITIRKCVHERKIDSNPTHYSKCDKDIANIYIYIQYILQRKREKERGKKDTRDNETDKQTIMIFIITIVIVIVIITAATIVVT